MKFAKCLLINISQESVDPIFWERLNGCCELMVSLVKDDPKLEQELANTDCILTGWGVPVTKQHMDLAPQLKYVGVLATAYARVDTAYAKTKGIVVTNIPGYSTEAVAELTFAVLLEYMREISVAKERARQGNYSESGLQASEIRGKTLAVVGLGSIGQRIAEIARGFGAQVVYWNRHRHPELESEHLKYQEMDSIVSTADIISINLAQTPETEGFFNRERLMSLKPGMVMVNTAPMELIDQEALLDRLVKNDMTFIMDHSDDLPAAMMKRLSAHQNFIAYPPIGYITAEARQAKQEIFLENIEQFLAGTPTHHV